MAINVLQCMTNTDIDRNYIIRYYPDSNDRHLNYLISLPVLVGLLARNSVIDNTLKRLDKNTNDRLAVKYDRGCTIIFVGR